MRRLAELRIMTISHIPYNDENDPRSDAARYIPESVRDGIESVYYQRVNDQTAWSHFAKDPEFLLDPASHLALYSDHGVVHVGNVASQIVRVLDVVNGVLIPSRSGLQREFMQGYGGMAAFVQYIGMRVDSAALGLA